MAHAPSDAVQDQTGLRIPFVLWEPKRVSSQTSLENTALIFRACNMIIKWQVSENQWKSNIVIP
jgi:hypothetical protein